MGAGVPQLATPQLTKNWEKMKIENTAPWFQRVGQSPGNGACCPKIRLPKKLKNVPVVTVKVANELLVAKIDFRRGCLFKFATSGGSFLHLVHFTFITCKANGQSNNTSLT